MSRARGRFQQIVEEFFEYLENSASIKGAKMLREWMNKNSEFLADYLFILKDSNRIDLKEHINEMVATLTPKSRDIFEKRWDKLNGVDRHKKVGIRFCKLWNCSHFYSGTGGQYCLLQVFPSQYTKACNKKVKNNDKIM